VIGLESRQHRYELATERIFKWIVPIYGTDDVRWHANGHRSSINTVHDILDEVFSGEDVLILFALGNVLRELLLEEAVELLLALNVICSLFVSLACYFLFAWCGDLRTPHL